MIERTQSLGRRKRLRGQLVVTIRNAVSKPIRRRVPVETLRRGHRLRRRLAPQRYTDADPFALIAIDPHRIERSILESAPKRPQWGRVEGGAWDQQWEAFDDRAVPRGIVQRYEKEQPWTETALYDAYLEQLQRFGNAWEHTSISAFERRCGEIDRLYESIRTRGYRRQERLLENDSGASPTIATRTDEINVDVGRDGILYWRGYGQHRLAIAKLLDLESVPVFVHRRHRHWQTVRDHVRTDGFDNLERTVSRSHPDLRDLLGRNEVLS